jgi:hypothetical protein
VSVTENWRHRLRQARGDIHARDLVGKVVDRDVGSSASNAASDGSETAAELEVPGKH